MLRLVTIPSPTKKGEDTLRKIKLTRGNLYRTQDVYSRYIKTKCELGVTTIYTDEVPDNCEIENFFFANTLEPIEAWVGCDVESVSSNDEYYTYKITPRGSIMVVNHI